VTIFDGEIRCWMEHNRRYSDCLNAAIKLIYSVSLQMNLGAEFNAVHYQLRCGIGRAETSLSRRCSPRGKPPSCAGVP